LQQNMQRWLSPPDPWKNHNIARESQHTGTATWWIHGEAFSKWKSSGPSSLLWLHGKRTSFVLFIRSLELIIFTSVAGAGKSVLWYVNLSVLSFRNSIGCHHLVPQLSRTSKAYVRQDRHHSHSSIVTSGRTKRRTGAGCFRLSWSSSVVNRMPTMMPSSNSMKHTIRAHDMPAIVN